MSLDDDLLHKVQPAANQESNEDFVHGHLPRLGRLVTVDVVILHGREERALDGEPPKEECSWKFQLFAHVPPFLAIIGEETCYEADWPGKTFSNNLRQVR